MLLFNLFFYKHSLRRYSKDLVANSCILLAVKLHDVKYINLKMLENSMILLKKAAQRYTLSAVAAKEVDKTAAGKAVTEDGAKGKTAPAGFSSGDFTELKDHFLVRSATLTEIEEETRTMVGSRRANFDLITKERSLIKSELLILEKRILADTSF
mmetsp:Transcript_16335/g.25238  ORF Transcript_16335/g.25238 Transcript_16335/m.25238 type:complete len:155 (+) Transcript_16335:274-738(+)